MQTRALLTACWTFSTDFLLINNREMHSRRAKAHLSLEVEVIPATLEAHPPAMERDPLIACRFGLTVVINGQSRLP